MNINIRAWDTDTNKFVDCSNHTISQINNSYAGLGNRYIYQLGTGLSENGYNDSDREIFSGDIIEFSNGQRLVVEWNDDTCQWQYSDGTPINSCDSYGTHKRIVGNVLNDPDELVKRGIITLTEAAAMKIG
jgi:hypothetical protein